MNAYQSKSDVVTAALRERIITGEFPAGTPLRQRDIAHEFAVSPTPVREALRRLQSEGLVHYDLHRGATVIEGTFGATEENYQVRAALEGLAARLAAQRITEEELATIGLLHEQIARSKRDDPNLTDLNRRFHFTIYESSRSPMLLALLRLLWQSFPDGPKISRPLRESVRQHEKIIESLAEHDPDKAEQRTREHILTAVPENEPAASDGRPAKRRSASTGKVAKRASSAGRSRAPARPSR